MCLQLSLGVVVLLGPDDPRTSRHISCVASRLEIPHVVTHVDAAVDGVETCGLMTVNVAPHWRLLSQLYTTLIDVFHWSDAFCVIYSQNSGAYEPACHSRQLVTS